MRALICFLLLLVSLPLRAATGDILGAEVLTNGFVLRLWVENMATNGTFNFGVRTNDNVLTNEMLAVSITSMGYDSNATAVAVSRTVYGEKQNRIPAGSGNLIAQSDGTNAVLELVLSQSVYSLDSNLVMTAKSGIYSVGAVSSAASMITVTNTSIETYPKPVAALQSFEYFMVTNELSPIVSAWSWSGKELKPVAAVKFILYDDFGNAVTNVASELTPFYLPTSTLWSQDYTTTFNTSGSVLRNTNNIQLRVQVFPQIGNVISDTQDTNIQPSGFWRDLTYFLNTNNAFVPSVVVLDPVNGNDSNSGANDLAGAAAHPVLSFSRALQALKDLHGSCCAGTIYIKATSPPLEIGYIGSNPFAADGTSVSAATIVTKYPTNLWTDIVLTNTSDVTLRAPKGIRLRDITYKRVSNNYILRGEYATTRLWLDHCRVITDLSPTNQSVALLNNLDSSAYTDCYFEGIGQVSATLMRGNFITNSPVAGFGSDVVGNWIIGNSDWSAKTLWTESSSPSAAADNTVIAFNKVEDWYGTIYTLSTGTKYIGVALIGNDFEISKSVGAIGVAFGADGGTIPTSQLIAWNNTIAGERCNWGYNESGTNLLIHRNWSVKNNIFNYFANKGDTYTPPNTNRLGARRISFGVGNTGNISRVQPFNPSDFLGFDSRLIPDVSGTEGYWLDNSASGTGVGFGDYRLRSDSVIWGTRCEPLLKVDLNGNPRASILGFDPPGAYSSGNAKKGGAFFAQ